MRLNVSDAPSAQDQYDAHVQSQFERIKSDEFPVKPYTFYGANQELQTDESHELIVGGPADCGKTIAGLYKMHRIAWENPYAQLAIVRKVRADLYSSAIESFNKKVLPYPPTDPKCPVRVYGGTTPSQYIYPNGSTIWLGGMDNPGKVLSAERDFVYVVQAEELTLTDWELLGTRVTGRAGYTDYPQLLGDCNPASPTHWIQQKFKANKIKLLNAEHRDNPELYDHEKQEWTPEGIKRLERLQALTGHRLQRLFYGLWVAPEGAIYGLFDEEKHKCAAFKPDRLWPRLVGVDPYGAYISAVWLAWDSRNKKLNVYREYQEPFGITTGDHALNIIKLSEGETIWTFVGGGPSERQQRVDFTGSGLVLDEPPNIGVWPGIDRINKLLKNNILMIHDSCPKLLSEIGDYRRKMKNNEPTDTIENKEMYHCLDALRYAVAWLLTTDNTIVQYLPA